MPRSRAATKALLEAELAPPPPPSELKRTVYLTRTQRRAGASYFEFHNPELIVRAILKCSDKVDAIEMSWPENASDDLPF